jgi:hypothetical protein
LATVDRTSPTCQRLLGATRYFEQTAYAVTGPFTAELYSQPVGAAE